MDSIWFFGRVYTSSMIVQMLFDCQELANPGKELDRLTFWRLIHSKPKPDASGIEPINEEAEKIFVSGNL